MVSSEPMTSASQKNLLHHSPPCFLASLLFPCLSVTSLSVFDVYLFACVVLLFVCDVFCLGFMYFLIVCFDFSKFSFNLCLSSSNFVLKP